MAHTKEMEGFQEALAREKSRVVALEAVQASMQTAHRDIMSRMQRDFDQEIEGLRNKVDAAHGDQVMELQDLLEDRHKKVRSANAGYGGSAFSYTLLWLEFFFFFFYNFDKSLSFFLALFCFWFVVCLFSIFRTLVRC